MVSTLDRPSRLRGGHDFEEQTVLDRDAAAKHHRRAYARPRSEQQHSRHPCSPRGRRMINWDPAAQTALSDEEVINKQQKGNLYYVRYEIVEQSGKFLEVATT